MAPHPVCLSPLCVPTGVRTNLLTLQPALRTLTSDYNGLKRQVRGFPLLLQEALKSVKAEVSAGPGWRGWERLWSPWVDTASPTRPSQTQTNPQMAAPFPTTHTAVLRPLEKQSDQG